MLMGNIGFFPVFLFFMDICSIVFQRCRKEATSMMFFSVIITYIRIAQYAVSTADLLPFILYDIYEPPIIYQCLGMRGRF